MNTTQKVLYGLSGLAGIAAGIFPQYSAFLLPVGAFLGGFATRTPGHAPTPPAQPTQQELPFPK